MLARLVRDVGLLNLLRRKQKEKEEKAEEKEEEGSEYSFKKLLSDILTKMNKNTSQVDILKRITEGKVRFNLIPEQGQRLFPTKTPIIDQFNYERFKTSADDIVKASKVLDSSIKVYKQRKFRI